eukprot:TRINITY_DN2348_c0_g1_i15.p1 TRINITY_DN2348_c0_g1~~TRINITY_DN2348_c0_g1_i15.p1  ORF type:complete len:612 (-),score=157.17 TRINITY_DN2348_c0_g1_i15:648-2453(-)
MDTSSLEIVLDLPGMKRDISRVIKETSCRGLLNTTKWLAEINFAIRLEKDVEEETMDATSTEKCKSEVDSVGENDAFYLAKSYFDLKEYDRSAFFSKGLKSHRGRFLHYYSRYMSSEKKRLDDMAENSNNPDQNQLSVLRQIRAEMEKLHQKQELDSYLLYIYGVVLRKLSISDLAIQMLIQSITKEPLHWGSWQELSTLVTTREKLVSLDLPDSWIRHMFTAHTDLELQQNEEALQIYSALKDAGLNNCTYIMAQIAIALHNLRRVEEAVDFFKQINEIDPYRLDNMDVYSNVLYVTDQRVELAHLAHKANQIDKYRTETCVVIGNYYSHSSQHEKAALYFQRALKLNPGYLSALTLLGHEYMEMKNTHAAIHSYRQAIEVNRRDYRAWYGLGQTYEILKMPYYCLYYYKQAQELRPSDSRMLVALGESYERLDKIQDAMKCFWKAHCVGDIDGGIALPKLAKLYEKTNEVDQAAEAYTQYILESQEMDRDDLGNAFKFLANYHLKRNMLDEAYEYAMKCTQLADVMEEGRALIKEIANLRGLADTGVVPTIMVMEDDQSSFAAPPSRSAHQTTSGGGNNTTTATEQENEVEPVALSFNT